MFNMEKLCTGCNRMLPVTSEYFHKKKNTRDGYCSRCKECICKYYSRYYTENHERVKNSKNEMSKEYYESNRATIIEKRRKRFEAQPEVIIAKRARYYLNKREHFLTKRREYVKTDEGKAKKKIHDQIRRAKGQKLESNFTLDDWKRCLIHFDNRCSYCDKQRILTREHFIPLVNGGEYTINNIIPACKSCNSKKRKSDFFQWYPKQPFYSKSREHKILRYLNYNGNNMQQLALL